MKKATLMWMNLAMLIAMFSLFARGNVHEDIPPGKFLHESVEDVTVSPAIIIIGGINCLPADTEVCVNEVVNYAVTNVPTYTYLWTVSGGSFPATTGSSINVTWGSPGTGSVSVTVLDSVGNPVHTCNWNIGIHPLPEPVISASFTSGCDRKGEHVNPGGTDKDEEECLKACDSSVVVYSTPLNPGSTYSWSVTGDISHVDAGNTVSVYWGSVGNGTVTVTETDMYGCSNTAEVCIEIIESPTAMFTSLPAPVGGVITICMLTPTLSQAIYFLDQSTAGVNTITNWYWDFGDGNTSVQQNPIHQYSGPGSYDVWLVVENECHCKDSVMLKVVVNPAFGPEIECASTVCAGATETYSTTATCAVYNWSVTGGTINQSPPYTNTITVTWGSTGPGVVTLDVSGCTPPMCTSPTSILIPIISPTTTISGSSIVCENSIENYSVPYLPGCIYNWTLTPPGAGTIITATNTSSISVYWPSGSTGGTLNISYYNPELDCQGQGTLNVTVGPQFAISGPDKVCVPSTAVYSGSPGLYNWTVKDGSGTTLQSSAGTNSINVNWTYPPGTYKVEAVDVSSTYCNSPQTMFVTLYGAPPAPTFINGPDSICPGQTYSYSSAPSSPAYYLAWAVTGGSPSSGTGSTINVTWNTSPPYVLSLYQVGVANPSCSSLVFTKNVYPKSIGTPAISGLLSTCNNIIVPYSATPTNGETYTWTVTPSTFGSVVSGQGTPNVNVQWNNSIGLATLTLKVKGCGDSATVSQNINLTAPPPPVILAPDSSCSGYSETFTSGTSGTQYDWDFGDGTIISTTSNPVNHSYVNPGNYNITLTVTSPGGCVGTSTTSKFILIYQSPTASLTTPDSTVYCTGQTINSTLFINTQPGNTFQWFGPGTLGVTTSSFNATTTGSYYVVVTSPNGCTATSNTIIISQIPCNPCNINPGAAISFTHSAPACNVVNFNGSITNGSIVGWTFSDPNSTMNSSTSYTPTHTFTESGYYQVTFTGKFPGTPDSCLLWQTQTVTIPAVADFEWKITGCSSGGFLFDFYDKTNTVSPFTVLNWNWSFGGGIPSASGLQNPSGILLTPGQQIVSLTIMSSGSTTCTITDTINVPNLPVAFFTSVDSVCDGNPVLFVSGSTGNLIEHLWDFGDFASSLLQPTTERTYDFPGTYNASLTVTDSFGCTSTYNKPVVVTPNTLGVSVTAGGPLTFCQGDSVVLTANPTGGTLPYGYNWPNTGDSVQAITADQTGDYTVILSDAKGCLKTSAPVTVVVNLPPIPVITGPIHYCAGETIELSANQGPANTYDWYVQGSYYSSGPDLIYPTNGFTPAVLNIYVVITGTNGCFDTSAVTQVFTHPLPLWPNITSSSPLLCAGTPITLTASNTQGLTQYTWNTGDTGASIVVNQGGLYTVTVYNQWGCGTESSISVGDLPDFSDLMTGCYDFCDTAGVLWVGPLGYASYQWLYNWNPIPGANSSNYYIPAGASGTYALVLTTYYGCTDTSLAIDINFHPCGQPCGGHALIKSIHCGPVDSNGNQTYYIDMGFTNPFGPGATYTLSTPLGTLSGLVPGTLAPGYNSVTGIFTYIGTYDPAIPLCIHGVISYGDLDCEFDICIQVPPCDVDPCDFQPDFTWVIYPDDPCTVYFTGLPNLPPGLTVAAVEWWFGDGFTSNVMNPSHTYATGGTYNVCFLVWATNGTDTCLIEMCKDVKVKGCYQQPCVIHPSFTFSQIDPCSFKFTNLTLSTPGVTITGWTWDFGDGFTASGGSPVNHTYTASGTYTVCLTVYATNGNVSCVRTYCIDINVKNCIPGPCKITPMFDFNQTSACTFNFTDYSTAPVGVSIYNWFWDFGDGNTLSGVQNPTHTYTSDGIYHVCLTVYAQNGSVSCFKKICWDIVVSGCGHGHPADSKDQELEVWPNPSQDRFYFDMDISGINKDNIRVLNIQGEDVSFEVGTENDASYIRLNTDQDGIYMLIMMKDGVTYKTRLFKH